MKNKSLLLICIFLLFFNKIKAQRIVSSGGNTISNIKKSKLSDISGLQDSLNSKASKFNSILTGKTKISKLIINSNSDNGNILQVVGNVNFNGNIGFGTAAIAGEMFHIGDGNMLLEGGGEVAQKFKRDFTTTGSRNGVPTGSGTSVNPIFSIGRIIEAGDGDPEIRYMYSDDSAYERTVFEVDRKGIVASVKTGIGSHFEGFKSLTDENPMFRLNSYPRMRLEMGAGGTNITDVAIERNSNGGLSLFTNSTERVYVSSTGKVGINNNSPQTFLDLQGNFRGKYVGTTVNYTLSNEYYLNVTANSITVTLPTAVSLNGLTYFVKNSGSGTVTINTTSSQTIDNVTTKTLSQFQSYQLVSDGTNWLIY